ncbi:ABC transporter substrate-binding protein [Aminobacter carboxidus]|uniref:ABC transporter substrate-binding protein n=1 Tax=Aminobacter carboxidus TaxID=376165 RepID=A0ABR9GUQ4_9HYPH|nr:ABC transporter substrate-binding protein [Aminobacter carboxidus]MBE1207415.1 ABC transporter substrate-binding protein [Aminobacter carboxidus]
MEFSIRNIKLLGSRLTRRTLFGAAIGATVLAVGLTGAQAQTKDVTVVLPGSSALAWYPMIVAKQQGFFAEEGLNVSIQSLDGSGAVIQAMEAGRAEFGAPGPGPALNAHARGADIKYFYNLFSRGLFVLAGERGDNLGGAGDLKGKQIGVSTSDGAEVSFTRSALASVGVKPEDYKFVTIGQEGMAVTAFQRDTIHAFAASFTGIAVLKDRGVDIVDLTPPGLKLFGNGLAVRGSIYRDNPEMVAAFTRAIHKASLWGQKNSEGVLDDGETYNPQEIERREYARALLASVIEQYKPFEGNALGFLPEDGWQAWHESLLATKELDKPIADLSAIYTNEFVEKLESE